MLRTGHDFAVENKKFAIFLAANAASFSDIFIAVAFDKQLISVQESAMLYKDYAWVVVPVLYCVGVATDFLVFYGAVKAFSFARKYLRKKSTELFLYMYYSQL